MAFTPDMANVFLNAFTSPDVAGYQTIKYRHTAGKRIDIQNINLTIKVNGI